MPIETKCRNVASFLLEGKNPTSTAVILLDRSYTYGDLESGAASVANYLVQQGGRKGDRVILIADNSFFWISAYLGTFLAGMVSVPLNPAISPEDLQHIVRLTEPRFAFLQSRVAARQEEQFGQILMVTDRGPGVSFADLTAENSGKVDISEVDSADLAAIMFTSGSTGKPRGVMVSHGNIVANTESIIEYLKLASTDRIMAVLPFYYCFGASLLHTHWRVGGSVVVDPRFLYPDKVLQRMAETECTGFAGVPSHYQVLLRRSSLKKMSFPHLRYVQQAGGHLAPVFVNELCGALPNAQVFVMYGQTEATARLSYLPPEMVREKPGSIGKGIPGVRLRVLNDSGKDVRPGESGEIVAEGGNITLGYWRDPEGTAATFRDGQLHTGDVGTVDDEGFIYLLDRTKDFVKCGGERVSCLSLEERFLECDALLEAAVIGIPDEVLGEAIKVFIVPREAGAKGLEARLRQFCKENIPLKLHPKSMVVLDSLPKNGSGKVLKTELRKL
jgi:long-chain acyl-CoA synthetase